MKSLSKVLVIFAVIIFIGVMAWFYFLDLKSPKENNHNPSFHASESSLDKDLHDQFITEQQKYSSKAITRNTDQITILSPEKSAWTLNNNIQPTVPLPQSVSIYEAVELASQDLYPQIGEQLVLPLPQANSVTVTVESSESHANGDYTWRAHLNGYGNNYPVVTTYGKHSSFSTITTPQGSYTLEIVNGRGWIYKNPSVIELSAPGHEDGLEIPR